MEEGTREDSKDICKLDFSPLTPHLTSKQGRMGPGTLQAPSLDPHGQNYFARNHHTKRLPNLQELVSRIEEARTSAKLLSQLVQSTPPSELLDSDLIKEFVDRCQSASRSVQAYMAAENPGPDNDTMETLIETNDQLSKAMTQHQRALLSVRKAAGLGTGTPTPPPGTNSAFAAPPPRTESGFTPPPGPPPSQGGQQVPINGPITTRSAVSKGPQIPPPGDFAPNFSDDDEETRDPFMDPASQETPAKVVGMPSSSGKVAMHAGIIDPEDEVGGADTERYGHGGEAGVKAPVYRY